MKTKLATGCLVAATTLILPTAGYGADESAGSMPTTSSATRYVKDSAITAKVKAQLTEEKFSNLVKISVHTDKNGAVTLSGSAPDQATVDKVGEIARGVEGVTNVDNRIKIVAKK